jgi:hypothetical protein
VIKPTGEYLRKLIIGFYELPGNISGGKLHIVLDDDNWETHHVEWCLNEAIEAGDTDAIFMANVLLLFTEDEREKILTEWWLN